MKGQLNRVSRVETRGPFDGAQGRLRRLAERSGENLTDEDKLYLTGERSLCYGHRDDNGIV